VSRVFLIPIIFFLFFLSSLGAESSRRFSNNDSESNIIEVGVRAGIGFRAKDRFESDLENFTSTFQPGVFSRSNVTGFRNLNMGEVLLRMGIDSNQRFGFTVGNVDYSRATLTEVTNDGFYTRLSFDINTTYLLFTYHYLWQLNKQWSLEAGLGLGANETLWNSGGTTYSIRESFEQRGRLSGNGISYRMESSFNFRPNDLIVLQIGILWGLHTVPSFNGSWNGASSTFTIREDGRTTPLSESRVTDTIILTNQFARSLDMSSSYSSLYFSTMLRFSY
jgi:hypothetical protein